jgi:hypothetical protein
MSFRSDSHSHVRALCSDDSIVLQVTAAPGWRTVYLDDLRAVASSRFRIALIDAITGTRSPKESLVSGWERNALSIRFMVPESTNGPPDEAPRHLAYLVLTPVA